MAREKLTAEESKFYTKIASLGGGTRLPIVLTTYEVAKLIGIVYRDTDRVDLLKDGFQLLIKHIVPLQDYYSIPAKWFVEDVPIDANGIVDLIRKATTEIADFTTYLRCLSEIHKRRKKYGLILSAQPMPTMVQVSPRSLLEYGHVEPEALASWLTWRKFFYDLDNRSAQETGYLFEPILAAAIGGEPKGARAKVVTRTGDASRGRQVDCFKVVPGKKPLAYEFKLRVTIAASRQGRLGEEHQFAIDCKNSDAVPILVILDPTPNPTMAALKATFEENGGCAFIGDEAWAHLEAEAGDVMARFIEKYVRQPVASVTAYERSSEGLAKNKLVPLLDLSTRSSNGQLHIQLGKYGRDIERREDESLSDTEALEDDE